jgi:hypothetical protein
VAGEEKKGFLPRIYADLRGYSGLIDRTGFWSRARDGPRPIDMIKEWPGRRSAVS